MQNAAAGLVSAARRRPHHSSPTQPPLASGAAKDHFQDCGPRREMHPRRRSPISAYRSRLYRKHIQTVAARHTFSRSISMQSALDMLMSMRYTNLRFIIIIICMNSACRWRKFQGRPRLRSVSIRCVYPPIVQTPVGQHSFAFHGPTVWNSQSVHQHCVTAVCHWTRFSGGWRLICVDSHQRHLATVWRFSAILAPDINVMTYLLQVKSSLIQPFVVNRPNSTRNHSKSQ